MIESRAAGAPVRAARAAAPEQTPSHNARLDTEYRPRRPVDVRRTVGYHRRGPRDPTLVIADGVIWRAIRTPEGCSTLALRSMPDGAIRAAAWGPGRDWAITQLPALCGAGDDDAGFDASQHPLVADAARRHPGLRLSRTDTLFDVLASAIIEQKVTAIQAFGAWRALVTWCGERAPGPTPRPMFVPPDASGWRLIPSWTWHRAGVEPPQSRTVVSAAAREPSIARALSGARTGDERDAVLTALPGIGPWTAAETRIRSLGDPDAVSIGDYHLAHHVGYALTGARTDDDGMLELLEPWRGHRQRVIRLIATSGVIEPRRAPRLHPEDHRAR